MRFIAYAHATFCSQKDFEAYYKTAISYAKLRNTVARRYFPGLMTFDAETAFRKYRPNDFIDGFHESGAGDI